METRKMTKETAEKTMQDWQPEDDLENEVGTYFILSEENYWYGYGVGDRLQEAKRVAEEIAKDNPGEKIFLFWIPGTGVKKEFLIEKK